MFHNELYLHLCFQYIINQYYMRLGVKQNLFSASLSYKKRGRLKIVLQIEHLKTCKIGMVILQFGMINKTVKFQNCYK